jgi:membrane associated rhomboid family serine protease
MLLGASGIAFMLIILSGFANAEAGTVPITLLLVIVFFLGTEVISGIQNVAGIIEDNVSQMAHIVGGVCGLFMGFLLNDKNKSTSSSDD